MKKAIFLFPLFCLFAHAVLAQKTAGIVQFDEKMNMHRNLPPDAADMKSMLPEWQIHKSELLFTASESLYRNLEAEEDDDAPQQGGMVIKIQRPEATYYRDFEAGRMTDSREFMGKAYLIQDSIAAQNWKMTGEAKEILGYNCLKATRLDTVGQRALAVWFTDEIAVPAGPGSYGNLPGMVLEVDINNGERLLVATKIEFKKPNAKDIAAPTKGEKITENEFNKMVAERMKANGGRMIRINRN